MTLEHLIPHLPAWNWALQALGLATSYIGAQLNARLEIRGFYFWLVSNATLAVLNALTGQWLLVILYLLFFQVSVTGACRWAREKPETAPLLARWLTRNVKKAG